MHTGQPNQFYWGSQLTSPRRRKRMKFSKLSQLFLVSSIGLLVAAFFSACAITTIDYVFVACSAGSGTSSAGQIEIFAVDSQSGALRTGAPTVSSGGVNPVSMAVRSEERRVGKE